MVTKTPKSAASKPSAWIVVNNQKDKSKPSDRGRKSIKNGKVYLDDGQEFEIELHNPLQECVLCDIKLNGQSISKSGLVLRPGERFYLDCFIDDKKKFIFNTYEVENNEESEKAIQKNGLLEVFFYKEQVVSINNWKDRFDRVIIEKWYPVYYPVYREWYYPQTWITYGSGTTLSGTSYPSTTTINTVLNTPSTFTSGTTLTTNGSTNLNTVYNSNSSTLTSGDSVNAYYSNVSYTTDDMLMSVNSSKINTSLETGRVEKGTSSSQKFVEIDMDFETNYLASTIIQILPSSRKPVETKEIVNEKTGEIKIEPKDEIISLIKKLADLHSAGILTDEEFSSKKAELLSKI